MSPQKDIQKSVPLNLWHQTRWMALVAILYAFIHFMSALPSNGGIALAAPTDTPIRVAYLYTHDAQTGEAYQKLLAPAGYAVELIELTAESAHNIYLPLVSGSQLQPAGVEPQALLDSRSAAELSAYEFDLFIVGGDTTLAWGQHAALRDALLASEKPLLALGSGGQVFLGQPSASSVRAAQITLADVSQSQIFVQKPTTIGVEDGLIIPVLNKTASLTTLTFPNPQPELVRIGQVGDAGATAVALFNQHALFWGLPSDLESWSPSGAQLLLNILSSLTQPLIIPVNGVDVVPPQGIEEGLLDLLNSSSDPVYGMLQLDHIPTPDERKQMSSRGLALQSYLSGTYYAVKLSDTFDPLDSFWTQHIRWLGEVQPEWKVDPTLALVQQRSAPENDILFVMFQADAPLAQTQRFLKTLVSEAAYVANGIWAIPADNSLIEKLALENSVRWISAGNPVGLDLLDNSRAATNTDLVQNFDATNNIYLGLTGAGVTVAEFEAQPEETHPDLTGRISFNLLSHPSISDHATHVAGIILGDGSQSISAGGTLNQWRGHAPEADMVSLGYSTGPLTNAQFHSALAVDGAEVSNHSYVMTFGSYDAFVSGIDTIVRGDATTIFGEPIPARTAVWAAGNQGGSSQYDNEEGYYSIYAPAKNVITVGAMNNNLTLRTSSSRGPTFDGRIKPDVMAPGCAVSTVAFSIFTDNDNDGNDDDVPPYASKCGTSMAAPATTGIVALMLEQYHDTFGNNSHPRPATIKAILVNTAVDMVDTTTGSSEILDPDLCDNEALGGNVISPTATTDPCWIIYGPGPDYATGYGAIDALAATDAVREKLFFENALSPNDTADEFTFDVGAGRPELRFTLAWDDEPGDPSLPWTTNQLVNDLDMRLVAPDGTIFFPFVLDVLPVSDTLGDGSLDPIEQSDLTNARQDDNNRDNVEQIVVANPMAGEWTLQVRIDGNFPTDRSQPYSVAGDMRSLRIVSPTTSQPLDVGNPATPGTFLLTLEAQNAITTNGSDADSSFSSAQVTDFSVEIGGQAATIVSGLPVGDQFWLMVRPQANVFANDYYDLKVTWTGYGSDEMTDAVFFLQNRSSDRVVVIDRSGSMGNNFKMGAAQNAARLFIDQIRIGDRLSVVSYANQATVDYAMTTAEAGNVFTVLNDAKTAVNGLIPTGSTAIGLALLEAKAQIDSDLNASDRHQVILLSDGEETEDPRYATDEVRGELEPSSIFVDTVALGPASAGNHPLMDDIAADTGGQSYHVSEVDLGSSSGLGPQQFDMQAQAASAVPGLWAQTLDNRLADTYLDIAQGINGEQRLWQAVGSMTEQDQIRQHRMLVDPNLDEITFSLNWAETDGDIGLFIQSPSGKLYNASDPDVEVRTDDTHRVWIIKNPEAGMWLLTLQNFKTDTEYAVWLTAVTPIRLTALTTTPAEAMATGEPVHIVAFVEDGQPIKDATVRAVVGRTSEQNPIILDLHDDGQHGDGSAGDGIYANWYLDAEKAGNYTATVIAEGTSNTGIDFTRYDSFNFFVRPALLYVYDSDAETAATIEEALEESGWAVDTRSLAELPGTAVNTFDLVMIGADTGSQGSWGTPEAADALNVPKPPPFMGLGSGGYAFFGTLSADIGYPNGASFTTASVHPEQLSATVWDAPFDIEASSAPLTLYHAPVTARAIAVNGSSASNLNVYGWANGSKSHALIIDQAGTRLLWGYEAGPKLMTPDGLELFINTTYFAAFGVKAN